jgi:TfoX/Sxy family transcriptional regulator of competence genes
MPYNEEIDARIRKIVVRWKNTETKKMFGGVCYLLSGNMVCGVYKDYLILRLGEKAAADVLKQSDTRPFDITGKPMKGWVMVEEHGFETEDRLKAWLDKAKGFVKTLPPK